MEYLLLHENKLKVILTGEDMDALALNYDQMDYQNQATRRALVRILDEGRRKTGFDPKKSKLFIEVYPCEGGGCALFFTSLQTGPIKERGGLEPVLFEFPGVDALVEGAARAFYQYGHRIYKSSLFRFAGAYRLVVYPLDYSDRLSVYFLSEYGRKIGEGELTAAYTEEHGTQLIRDQAIETLAGIAYRSGNELP